MRLMAATVLASAACAGGLAAELVPFVLPWDDDSPGPTDLSGTTGKVGPVRVKGGHLFVGRQRLRLFGVNMTGGGCFPDHQTAEKVAARMAKFGLNAVRLHFLDSTWGEPRLIRYESGDWKDWNGEALDRLDYFVAKLKERGIYIDLNLLVGRRFGVGDGVDPSVNQLDWKTAHAVGFFHAPHLEAQKAYARRLLAHRNPYTGLAYAEDPVVALVELNNENGLIHTWMGGGFDALPEVFARDLARQWNEWLAGRYGDTASLRKAWGARDEPLGAEMLANAQFAQGLQGWNVEQHQGAAVESTVENGAAVLRVRRTGTAGWHVQLNQPGLVVKKGAVYTVSFRAAADRERKIRLSLMQAHEPWGELGLGTTLALNREMKKFTFAFLADADDDNARLNFGDMNQAGAEFRFADLSLRTGGRTGLAEGESLERRNVGVPKAAADRALPAEGRKDWLRFLWETERRHWTELRRFLKTDLGVKAPIVGTIVATSTPHLMAEFDVVDTHAYWEHPQFPGAEWDQNNWFVRNISMVDYPEKAIVTYLAFQRVAGKPHMVSEYNHPAPNTHAGEGPLFAAVFGALQDWDAIFLYTYAHDERGIKAGRIPGFFDVGQHPTIMANVPVASLVFRSGDVSAARQVSTIPLAAERELDLIAQKGHAWGVLDVWQLGLDLRGAIRHRVALDLTGRAAMPDVETLGDGRAIASDTGEVAWRLPAKDAGVLEVRSPRAKLLVGHVDGRAIALGDGVEVEVGRTRTGWCTLALVLVEGESFARRPRRALVVATGYTENTGMGWKDETKSSVGTNWGNPPSLVEPVAAAIRVPRDAGSLVLYPLDERGQRGQGVPAVATGATAEVRIGPPHKTVWYELEWQ